MKHTKKAVRIAFPLLMAAGLTACGGAEIPGINIPIAPTPETTPTPVETKDIH